MSNSLAALGVTQAQVDAILASDEVTDAKIELAERVAQWWRDHSPVDTGHYRDSVHVEVHGNKVQIVASDEAASLIEFGSEHNPEFAVRARTVLHFSREA